MGDSWSETLRRWGLASAACGVVAALGHHLVQLGASTSPPWGMLALVPKAGVCGLLLAALASAQWRLLRGWLPGLSRWWVAVTVGSLATLGGGYNAVSDGVGRAPQAGVGVMFEHLGMPGWLGDASPPFVLGYGGLVVVGTALAQTLQQQRHLDIGARWLAVNALAAMAAYLVLVGLTRLPPFALTTLLTGGEGGLWWWWLGNVVVTAAAYAAFGAATGAGFRWLLRRQRGREHIELVARRVEAPGSWPH